MELLVDPQACDGCRICELACSFYHQKAFAPESSSIKISSDYVNGEVQLFIDATCDLCKVETQPMCVEYCGRGALKKVMENERP